MKKHTSTSNKALASVKRLFKTKTSTAVTVVAVFIVIGLVSLIASHAATVSATLTLTPTTETVTNGSDVVITVSLNPEGNSINTVQSVLTYPSANFSFVSATAGSSFGSFIDTPATGSVAFTVGSTTPVSGSSAITVATITLLSNTTGSSLPVTLASVCPAGNYALTCSAAYDSATNGNDLNTVGSASYTVNPPAPTVPANFTSTATTTSSISLSWTPSTDAGGTIGGYYLFRNGTEINLPASDSSYTDTSLSPGTSYSYYLEAYNTATPVGVSSATSTISASTVALPTAPGSFKTTGTTASSVSLSWTASTDTGGPGLGGYYLYRYVTSAGASTATKIASPAASATTYTDSGLSTGINYTYYIEAYDTSNNISAQSTVTASTVALPSTPTLTNSALYSGLSSTATYVGLSWTASTDTGGPGLGGYYLYRYVTSAGASTATKLTTLSATTTTYADIGLSANTSYSYYVEAYDTASTPNVSIASATISVTTGKQIGDIDGSTSGVVDGHDLSILLSNFNTNYPPAEFDGTTTVQAHDLSIFISNYDDTV